MKNLNLFRKSARGSEGSTLASTIVRPSFDCRSTVVKHLAFMLLFLLGSLNVWGDSPYEHLFTGSTTPPFETKKANTTQQTATLSELSWTINTSQTACYFAQTTTTGLQVGSKANQSGNFTLSTSELNDYTITQVEVECSRATNSTATLSVTVGENALGTQNQSLETTASALTFSNQTGYSGDIVLSFTNPTVNNKSTAVYIKRVTITYTTGGSSCETFAAPTNPSSTPAQTSVVLNWDAVENASGYKVVFNGTDYDIASGITTKTIEGLAMETEYHWTVAAKGDGSTYCEAGTATAQQSVTTLDACIANKAVYTVYNKTSVTTSGALEGSTATFLNNGTNNDDQMTAGKSMTLTLSGYAGATIKGLTLRMRSNGSSGAGTFSLVIGSTTIAEISNATGFNAWFDNTSFGTAYRNVHVPFDDDVVVGTDEDIVVTIAATANSLYCQSFSFCYEEPAPVAVAKPTFSVAGGSYLDAQSVEINCATAGADIYYTLDGADPSSASTPYSGAISISETKTLKAIAIKGSDASAIASATYTIVVPKSVDEIWNEITADGPTDAYVWGYVSQADVNGNNTYYISVNGSTEGNQLEIYKGDNDGHTISKGDKVVVNGNLTIWGSTKEFASGTGKVVRYNAKGSVTSVAVSGTATKTTYSANETFETAGLVVTATYANGFSEVVTEGITWGDDLTDHKVAATGTVHVTATVGGIISAAYGVAIEVSTKALSSIAVGTDSYTVYKGQALPKPVITATYTEGEPADVSAEAVYDTENVFDNTTADTYTITVSYTFGGETKTATYEVTVKEYANDAAHPYTVADAKQLIESVFADESADDIYVHGIVSEIVEAYQAKFGNVTYNISDDGTTSGAQIKVFRCTASSADDIKEGDEVIVKGHAIYYQSSTPELLNTPTVVSLARTPNFDVEAVTGFEVGSANLAVADLTITQDGEGAVTLASSNNTDAVTIVDGKLHAVAPGTATITANLDADGIYKAATYEFSVTVIAAQVKYAITFDGNGADGGEAPEAIANKAAGAEVTLPANSYTKTGYTFSGWKVFYVDGESVEHEVTISENAFTMPAFAVTIQAQWAEVSVWATTYTSNVILSYTGTGETNSKVKINATEYPAQKVGSGSNDGSVVVTVPSGTHTLHFHAVAWNGKSVTITASGVENMSVSSFSLIADAGFKASGTYTLENDPVDQYFAMTFDAVAEETQITFSKTDGDDRRFLLYGVNQEGGILPVLESIEISGDLTTKTGYKAGDALNMDGLTVMATYTLGGTPQAPVNITDKLGDGLTLTYDPLVEGQTEVTITATYEGKSDDIEITGLEVASADPKIYVDKLSVDFGTVAPNASVENKTITVTLTNVAAATATLGGTNPEAFSITPASPAALTESGDITISVVSTANVGTYSATITISDDASAAESKIVNLSLTVEDVETAVSTTSKWVAATDADLVDGAEVLITGVKDAVTYAMGADRGNNRGAVAASVDGEGVLTPGEGTMSFILEAQGDGTFALRTSNGKYLYAAGSSSNNHLKTRAAIENGDAKWTLTATSAIANGDNTNETVRFNSGNNPKIFSCYADESKQSAIALYVPQPAPEPVYETVRSGLTAGNYYTVCLDRAVTAVRGASFWTLSSRNTAETEAYLEEVDPTTAEAGTPFIIQATAAQLEVVYTGAATTTAGTNGALHGTLTYMDADALAAAGTNIYMLYQNALRPVGTNNHLDANRAYIDYDALNPVTEAPNAAPGKRVRAMPMAPQVATGVDQVPSDQVPNTKVLINGQLFILHGEKMYNANGQLVK